MPPTSEPTREPSSPSATTWARYAGLGVQFAATLGVFVGLGMWADARWGTSPWFVLVGAALGFTGALIALLRAVPPARARTSNTPAPPQSKRPPFPQS